MKFICIGIFVFCLLAQRAFASCGAASCPLNNYRYIQAGFVGLNIVHEYINQDRVYVGSSRSFVGEIPEEHDEVQTLNERNVLQIQMGLSDALALRLDAPFIHREHNHIYHRLGHDPAGDEWEYWNFTGFGDVSLLANYTAIESRDDFQPSLTLTAGVKVPTGATDERSTAGEIGEVTIQPGTGSTDFIAGFNLRQNLFTVRALDSLYSAVPLTVGMTYQMNRKGTDDYRFGNSLLASIGTGYQFARHGSLLLQVNGRFQGYADVGLTGEPRESTGGTWIFLSPGLDLELSDQLAGTAFVQLPLYQNVNGIQQTAPFNLSFSLGYSFNLNGE